MTTEARGPTVPEADFQRAVTDLLSLRRYRWVHFRKSIDPRRKGQWRTAQDGDKGFVDIFAVRDGRALAIELKGIQANGRRGALDPDQKLWGLAFVAVPGIEWFCWWPDDWDEIERILR